MDENDYEEKTDTQINYKAEKTLEDEEEEERKENEALVGKEESLVEEVFEKDAQSAKAESEKAQREKAQSEKADSEQAQSEKKSSEGEEVIQVQRQAQADVTQLAFGRTASESGSSDSDYEPKEEKTLQIRPKQKFFNSKKQLEKFIRKVDKEDFVRFECSGNSYDPTSCEYIAELITNNSSEELWYADFSNMFITRDKATLPPSLKLLIDSISQKPIQQLYLADNAFGPIGVDQFKDFLENAPHLKVLSVTNTGLGPEAAATIANSLKANEHTKLTKLCISRSRVEEGGALALADYFKTYDSLEYLEIYQNGIRDEQEGSSQLALSLLPSAKSGNLKHLEINDNFFHEERALTALCKLISEATQLEYLNIDSSNLDDEAMCRKVLDAIVESESKATLNEFFWNYDACDLDGFVEELLELFIDASRFQMIEVIEMRETLENKKKRNELRKRFKEAEISLILSDR